MPRPDLHIVAFSVPFPARYGGAIDVYNRLRALHKEGVKISLHCFVYSSFSPHDALKEITTEVHYYPRITWPALLAPGLPYIVSSRKNPLLLNRLKEDDVPVLFEGIHTTGFMDELPGKKKFLRAHNIEHQYYGHLAKESQRFQYLFFQREALALERYEFNHADSFNTVFNISSADQAWYQKKGARSEFMPAYHGMEKAEIKSGKGTYLLYQGDLSIETNQKAVIELIRHLPGIDQYPFVIAGQAGDSTFEEKLTKYPNLRREVNVSEEKMIDLIRDAQIVIVHSRNPSGMKVKIFPALYHGRFVIANDNSLTHTKLDNSLHVYKHVNEVGQLIEKLWLKEFTEEQLKEREDALTGLPSDQEKAKAFLQFL
jgi:hypothetical protein